MWGEFPLNTIGEITFLWERGLWNGKNMLRVETGWGFFDRATNRLFGKWNGMEWNVRLGNAESGYIGGVRFGGLANHLTKLTRGRENEIRAEEGRGGMGGGLGGVGLGLMGGCLLRFDEDEVGSGSIAHSISVLVTIKKMRIGKIMLAASFCAECLGK